MLVSLFKKVADLQASNFIKKRTQQVLTKVRNELKRPKTT